MKSSLPPYYVRIDPITEQKSLLFYPYADKRTPSLAELFRIATLEFPEMRDFDEVLCTPSCLVGIELSLRVPEKAIIK